MFPAAIFVAICLALVSGETNVHDFDSQYKGFQVIFHDDHNLLLAINNDSCYFATVPDSQELNLVDSPHSIVNRLEITEDAFLRDILSGSGRRSTLEDVRDKYRDILADYHCLSKDIFEINYFTTTPPGGRTTHHYHVLSCGDQTTGTQPYPDNCHKYLTCDHGHTIPMDCAPGTLYSDTAKACVLISQAPAHCQN